MQFQSVPKAGSWLVNVVDVYPLPPMFIDLLPRCDPQKCIDVVGTTLQPGPEARSEQC